MDQLFDAIQRLARSPAFKFFLVTFLILMLLVPLALVIGLVQEREGRARQVQGEVARVWGAAQQLSGPFLVVPYTVRVETVRGDKRIEQLQERRAVFLPEQLDVKAHTTSKVLYRSIYEVAVYTARANLEGRFLAPDMADVASDVVSVRWSDAIFVLGLTACGCMLATYVGMALQSRMRGLAMLVVLSTLYGLLYLILKLEDYALLAGAMLGFAALTVVMFATLRVDWSGRRELPAPAE